MNYIYKITNTENGKIYIGQTNNPDLRWSQHKSNAKYNRGNQVITKAIIKYGVKLFKFEVIATCNTKEHVDFIEEKIIKQYGSCTPKGYNVDSGGNTSQRTPEILQKISESLRKHYETHDSWLKGGKLTEEWKDNISKASIGKPGTNICKKFGYDWSLAISKSLVGIPQLSKRKFSKEIEKEICISYNEKNKSIYALGKQFNCNRNTILNIIKRNNIKIRKSNYTGHSNGKNIFSFSKELEICKKYSLGKVSRSELARQYSCGRTTIRDILLRHNIKL